MRYRYNAALGKRRTTVELVVEEVPWKKRRAGEVGVEIRSWEGELRKAVLAADGRWDGERKLWLVAKQRVESLGLQDRVKELKTKLPERTPRSTGKH